MHMSKEEKRTYFAVVRRRYAVMRTKRARSGVLDDFCGTTGLTRKHAIKILSPKRRPCRRRGRPPGGTPEGAALLARLWRLSDMMCGKLLKAVLGMYLASLREREDIPDEVCREVLGMSASTIDRRLRGEKAGGGGRKRRRASSLDAHRREIPLKVDVWPEPCPKTPGYVEVDTVAHCGGSMSGNFNWTLVMTDVATQWTELQSVWNKGAAAVCGGISGFIARAPFDVIAVNSDNGGECINSHIKRYFSQFLPQVVRTRSRSYRKNDNAHVEQKNGVQVRALYGHARIDDEGLLPLMNRINECQSLIKNLFTPTMRLLSKERAGTKYVKRFERQPKTPAQRILESPDVPEAKKDAVRAMIAANNIIDLRERMDADLRLLARKLASAPAGAALKSRPEQRLPAPKPGSRTPARKSGNRTIKKTA